MVDRQLINYRARYKRLMQNFENDIDLTDDIEARAQEALQNLIDETYAKSGSDFTKVKEHAEMFFNMDYENKLSDLVVSGNVEKQLYAYTNKLWIGTDYHNRMEKIQEVFGGNTPLETAQNFVKETGINIFEAPAGDSDFYEVNKRKAVRAVNRFMNKKANYEV